MYYNLEGLALCIARFGTPGSLSPCPPANSLFHLSQEILFGASQFHLWPSQCLPTRRILFSPPVLFLLTPFPANWALPLGVNLDPQPSPLVLSFLLSSGESSVVHRALFGGGREDNVRNAPAMLRAVKSQVLFLSPAPPPSPPRQLKQEVRAE